MALAGSAEAFASATVQEGGELSPARTSVSSRSRKTESRCRAGAYFYRDTVR